MAVRLLGVVIPNEKRVETALTYIYGIGLAKSMKILAQAKVENSIRVKDLTEDQIKALRVIIEKEHRVEGDLRRDVSSNVKRLKEIGSYRGSRHAKGLPARGQRTKTNNRTLRGNKRATSGSGRKNANQKT